MRLLADRCVDVAVAPAANVSNRIVRWLQAHASWMRDFMLNAMPDLSAAAGNAWANGEISIKHEHLYAETLQALIRQGIPAPAAAPESPRILLDAPRELHNLGLLTFEAVMSLAGATGISLSAQMPLAEIASAAQACVSAPHFR